MIWPVHLVAYYPFHKSVTPLTLGFWQESRCWACARWLLGFLWKRHHLRFLRLCLVLHQHCSGAEFPLAGPQRLHREISLPSFRGLLLGGRLVDPVNLEPAAFCGKAVVTRLLIQEGWRAERRGGYHLNPKARSRNEHHPLPFLAPQQWIFRAAFGTALAALAVLAFVRIVTRNRDWRDDATYYRVTLAAVPEAGSLRLNLGAVYWNRMQPDAAEREWKKALVVSPDSAQLLNNLGLVCARRKKQTTKP